MEEIAQFAAAAQEEIRHDLSSLFRGAIRVMLECLLEQEVKEMVGARRYERLGNRKDHLNGTYLRRLLTSMGSIDLAVPRTRQSGSPGVVGRYKRRTEDMDRLMTTAYVQGVSTRDMTKLSEALMGVGSASEPHPRGRQARRPLGCLGPDRPAAGRVQHAAPGSPAHLQASVQGYPTAAQEDPSAPQG